MYCISWDSLFEYYIQISWQVKWTSHCDWITLGFGIEAKGKSKKLHRLLLSAARYIIISGHNEACFNQWAIAMDIACGNVDWQLWLMREWCVVHLLPSSVIGWLITVQFAQHNRHLSGSGADSFAFYVLTATGCFSHRLSIYQNK